MFLGILLLLSLIFPLAQADQKPQVVEAADGVPIHYSVPGKGRHGDRFCSLLGAVIARYWDNQVAGICEELSRRDYRSSGAWPVGAGKKELVHSEFWRRCQNSCHEVGPQASGA